MTEHETIRMGRRFRTIGPVDYTVHFVWLNTSNQYEVDDTPGRAILLGVREPYVEGTVKVRPSPDRKFIDTLDGASERFFNDENHTDPEFLHPVYVYVPSSYQNPWLELGVYAFLSREDAQAYAEGKNQDLAARRANPT